MGGWSDRRRAKLDRCQNLEESGVRPTVLEAEDKGGQGSIWAVEPLERERESPGLMGSDVIIVDSFLLHVNCARRKFVFIDVCYLRIFKLVNVSG